MNHCATCPTPLTCRDYGNCSRPATGLDYAIREAQAAIKGMEAAAKRLNNATANLAAAQVIHNLKGQA